MKMVELPPGTLVEKGTRGIYQSLLDGPPSYEWVDVTGDFVVPQSAWVKYFQAAEQYQHTVDRRRNG